MAKETDEDWLKRRVKEAVKTVESWPAWKQQYYSALHGPEARKKLQEEYEAEDEHRRRYSYWPPKG